MKKKIVSFVLAVALLLCAMPLAVLADVIEEVVDASSSGNTSGVPVASVSSQYLYENEQYPLYPSGIYACADAEGNFYLNISLDKAPENGEDVRVYYRTVDDSAVAKWGDYESVGVKEEAYVTLNKANSYNAQVVIKSTVMSDGLSTPYNSHITRRFLFELTRAEGGNAEIYIPKDASDRDKSEIYCNLSADRMHYQSSSAQTTLDDSMIQLKMTMAYMQYFFEYRKDAAKGDGMDTVMNIWNSQTADITYDTSYKNLNGASMINTPKIQHKGSHSGDINLSFDKTWQNYASSGWCDLGLSINGNILSEKAKSHGDVTFNLYYTYQGEKRLALSLYIEGYFDDSKYFGWEHAYEYAVEGLKSENREAHMEDNFIGFTVYDNDGNVAYEIKMDESRSGTAQSKVCELLKNSAIAGGFASKMLSPYINPPSLDGGIFTLYYLKLPSNFTLADSYSYDFISDSTNSSEIRYLQNVDLCFALIQNEPPMIEKDENSVQMVTTNLEDLKAGDKLRVMVRFDKPVYVNDIGGNCCITAKINARYPITLKLRWVGAKIDGAANGGIYYASDTLVFEADLPEEVDGLVITSLTNLKLDDGSGAKKNPSDGIRAYITNHKLLATSIGSFSGFVKDLRVPTVSVSDEKSTNYARSKVLDISVKAEGTTSNFEDYITLYYQWSSSPEATDRYDEKMIFHTAEDGELTKTIAGTGDGNTYLHVKVVSGFGKESKATFGPYLFDNSPPRLAEGDVHVSGNLLEHVIEVKKPSDLSGFHYMDLYYIPVDSENGEAKRLKSFKADDFGADTLSYKVTYEMVGIEAEQGYHVVKLYWVLADKLGNTSGPTAHFSLIYDTNDYLSVEQAGPHGSFKDVSETKDAQKFIYDYGAANNQKVTDALGDIYYSFEIKPDIAEFLTDGNTAEEEAKFYSVRLLYKGDALIAKGCLCMQGACEDCACVLQALAECDHTCTCENCHENDYDYTLEAVVDGDEVVFVVCIREKMQSGEYTFQLVKTRSDSTRSSQIYSVFATNLESDPTATKEKVDAGTLLINTVYQLSTDTFYYKDADGITQKVAYNGENLPATFSSAAKAKEFVYYYELRDIYVYRIPSSSMADALNDASSKVFRKAVGETMEAKEGQYWIRYKSRSWEPTSGDSGWVYYYYADVYSDGDLSKNAFSVNLLTALDMVATRIVGYGGSVILTDTSLVLGGVQGTKMLNEYGMPYLKETQIHNLEEITTTTMCGDTWSVPLLFAGDSNIYRSYFTLVGNAGEASARYPIIGSFALPAGSIYQYMTLANYEKLKNPYNQEQIAWTDLSFEEGQTFVDVFDGSGIYYIREICADGVCVFPVCVDKEAPEITVQQRISEKGDLKTFVYNGRDIVRIGAAEIFIGGVSATEYDDLAYVAIYKSSDFSLVSVHRASDLASVPVKLSNGKYSIVVADRSGNSYTLTADVNITPLSYSIKESENSFIRFTCSRAASQIMVFEIYRNGMLETSTYANEITYRNAGRYSFYIRDIYGNEVYEEYEFSRIYPEAEWRYQGADGNFYAYNFEASEASGFVMSAVSENEYKISTSVATRFSIGDGYVYEFIGATPQCESPEIGGAKTSIIIKAGQSFKLKISYKNHKDCYTIYSGVVDVTPPSISVQADLPVVENGENALFEAWLREGISMQDIYYRLIEIRSTNLTSGASISTDVIKINANDANGLSLVEVYRDGVLLKRQDASSGFSQIVVNDFGEYRIVVKDALGNVSTFTFTNGTPSGLRYYIDGAEKSFELHGYLYFTQIGGKMVYTKVDYGKNEFRLDLTQSADVFMSVGVSGSAPVIQGFRVQDGCIYPLSYVIHPETGVELSVGAAIFDARKEGFKLGNEYEIQQSGTHKIYAALAEDGTVILKVYAADNAAKIVSVNARVELIGSHTMFVSSEISKKSSVVSFDNYGVPQGTDVRFSTEFSVNEAAFEGERIESIRLYYSRLNDLDINHLEGKVDIYSAEDVYEEEGFYLLIVRNLFGTENAYRISVSRSFGITSSVTFSDGQTIRYSKEYNDGESILYSDHEITLDIFEDEVTTKVLRNGAPYTGYSRRIESGITYLVFSEQGSYEVRLTDSYGNVVERRLEISKAAFSVGDEILTGYNEKAHAGYSNQLLSVNESYFAGAGIYYLAVSYEDTITVLFDAFSERSVSLNAQSLINAVGAAGDGVYTVICRNRYGTAATKEIRYRSTPTLQLERTTRSKSEVEAYDLAYAISLGFWSNNSLIFRTDALAYEFMINGVISECPRTLIFENSGDFGSTEYTISYKDEYGFEYSFKAYLVRQTVEIHVPAGLTGIEIGGVLNTQKDISITFAENAYATYTRNGGEEILYHSGEILKKDGTYRFTVSDYAGNIAVLVLRKDTMVDFAFTESASGATLQSGGVVNTPKVSFNVLNKDSAYIKMVLRDGVVLKDFAESKFTEDGKWELLLCDTLGNEAYFCFYIITKAENGFAYTTPYEYHITEMWFDNGDGARISYLNFVVQNDFTSSFAFSENGEYTVVMTSDLTGNATEFSFTVNTTAPAVSLLGCEVGETTINDVSITGCTIGDRIMVYKETDTGETLVEQITVTSSATKMPTIVEGGKYRIVVESEAGVATELSFVRKHVMNTSGSVFVMVVIGICVAGLFTGLIYRNKSKTDD